MNARLVAMSAAFLFMACGGLMATVAWRMATREQPQDIVEPLVIEPGELEPLEEFTLTERTGKPFGSKDLAGDIWVANVFFTTCPASCLKQSMKVKEIADVYGSKGVKFLSITCNPEIDTPSVLTAYADRLQAHPKHWLFLTGKLDYIQRVGRDILHFPVDITRGGHTDYLVLVDQSGQIRGYFDWKVPEHVLRLEQQLDGLLDPTVQNEPSTRPESTNSVPESQSGTPESTDESAPQATGT